jgi:hypothetical protein
MTAAVEVLGPLLPLAPDGPAVRGATAAGLRYPTPQDPVCDTDQYIHDLADDITRVLNNRAVQVSTQWLSTDANANFVVSFPKFSVLQGLVIQPFVNGGGSGVDVWTVLPFLSVLSGNTATVHCWYVQVNREGYGVLNFVNAGFGYSIFAWGVPV